MISTLDCSTPPTVRSSRMFSTAILLLLLVLGAQASQKRSISADDFAKAFEHGARVRAEGSCHDPRPTIVYVNTTSPSKVYLPRGTVLHRCSDLTGCCQHPSEQCEPIEMQTVELYFISMTLQVQSPHQHNRSRRVRQSPQVEKILFTNHTQCGCRERNTAVSEVNSNSVDDMDNNELK